MLVLGFRVRREYGNILIRGYIRIRFPSFLLRTSK